MISMPWNFAPFTFTAERDETKMTPLRSAPTSFLSLESAGCGAAWTWPALGLATGVFGATLLIGGLLSRIAPFHLTGDSLSAVLGSLFVDSSTLTEVTGFNVPFSVNKGMSLTAEWYKTAAGANR